MATFIGLMVGLKWFKGPSDNQQQEVDQEEEVCDANNQWCEQTISGHQTSMRISTPEGDTVITPTPITIEFKGLAEAESLRVRMSGYNMYMGQFDIDLQRQGDSWQANTPLPSCTPDHDMIWRIKFLPPYTGTYYFTSTDQVTEEKIP